MMNLKLTDEEFNKVFEAYKVILKKYESVQEYDEITVNDKTYDVEKLLRPMVENMEDIVDFFAD